MVRAQVALHDSAVRPRLRRDVLYFIVSQRETFALKASGPQAEPPEQ